MKTFLNVWQRLGGQGDATPLHLALTAAYAEPQRAYHTATHLQACLSELTAVRALAEQPDAIEMALWFHDAIYNPRVKDNEERSAAWTRQALTNGKISPTIVQKIAALILITKHQALPETHDEKLMADIDLSILGQTAARFSEYDHQIRLEYDWVPENEYRRRRGQVLTGFLARPTIYQTEYFYTRYESLARQNITQAIARLVNE